jgi:hypothetical protein
LVKMMHADFDLMHVPSVYAPDRTIGDVEYGPAWCSHVFASNESCLNIVQRIFEYAWLSER